MKGSYSLGLVALSVVIAILTSGAALDLANRVTSARGRSRLLWLSGGAFAMGQGIWSMHYVGMLAFHLPVPVLYNIPIVLASLLAAVFASAVALFVVSGPALSLGRVLTGSAVMGGGIAGMHYTGMAAMRMPATLTYNPVLFALSVLIAIVVALVALLLSFHLRADAIRAWDWRKIAGSVVMGAAIPALHYTAMAAARFAATGGVVDRQNSIAISSLGTAAIAGSALVVLALALGTSVLDRRLSGQEEALREAVTQLTAQALELTAARDGAWRSRRRLEHLSHRLLDAQEVERRHIARELHDDLGQALTAVKLNLQALSGYDHIDGTAQLSESIAIVDGALRSVRTLSLALRPPVLDDLGLAAALRWYADQYARRTGLRVHAVVEAPPGRLLAATETACFRIAQEALTNVARHAHANRVGVDLTVEGSTLILAVRDDGVGFDLAATRRDPSPSSSMGLQGMEERAALAGGQIEIMSAPGHGTEVRARFAVTALGAGVRVFGT